MGFKLINYFLTFFSPNLPEIKDAVMTSSKGKKWLAKNLSKEMKVFEYGSGGSTLYMAKRVKNIITVEHQYNWYLAVKRALEKNKLSNFKIHHISAQPLTKKNSFYEVSIPKNPKHKDLSFEKYVTTINKYPDNFFDLIFIDGRARNSCLKLAISKVKNGGYIFLDDSNRVGYLPGIKKLKKFEKINLNNAVVWKVVKK